MIESMVARDPRFARAEEPMNPHRKVNDEATERELFDIIIDELPDQSGI